MEDETLIEIAGALGLGDTVGAKEVITAINSQTAALVAAQKAVKTPPALDQFVPRADFDKALNRANTAEATLVAQEAAGKDAAIELAVTAALQAGKITPATAEYHKAACRDEGGLDRFATFVAAAPEIAGAAPAAIETGKSTGTLDDTQKAACRALGISSEDFLKTITAETKEAA